ncbi:MAG: hypothetical protein Q8Q09_13585 [Deltaproteobacteria bacterium]|nr:hypothetical protein [Deltaproteobacteria bacterium]
MTKRDSKNLKSVVPEPAPEQQSTVDLLETLTRKRSDDGFGDLFGTKEPSVMTRLPQGAEAPPTADRVSVVNKVRSLPLGTLTPPKPPMLPVDLNASFDESLDFSAPFDIASNEDGAAAQSVSSERPELHFGEEAQIEWDDVDESQDDSAGGELELQPASIVPPLAHFAKQQIPEEWYPPPERSQPPPPEAVQPRPIVVPIQRIAVASTTSAAMEHERRRLERIQRARALIAANSLTEAQDLIELLRASGDARVADKLSVDLAAKRVATLSKPIEYRPSAPPVDPLTELGGLQTILRVLLTPAEQCSLSLDPRSAFLLSMIDGTMSVDDMCDVSGMDRAQTLTALRELKRRKVVA